jgi:hypothetical protein
MGGKVANADFEYAGEHFDQIIETFDFFTDRHARFCSCFTAVDIAACSSQTFGFG